MAALNPGLAYWTWHTWWWNYKPHLIIDIHASNPCEGDIDGDDGEGDGECDVDWGEGVDGGGDGGRGGGVGGGGGGVHEGGFPVILILEQDKYICEGINLNKLNTDFNLMKK